MISLPKPGGTNSTRSLNSTCILLTATIDVKESMPFVERRDSRVRLTDYKKALLSWLADTNASRLVLCENSGADLKELCTVIEEHSLYKNAVEVLSFDGQSSIPAYGGKGYGEMLALAYMLDNSETLASSEMFVKVTGRYYVRNIRVFLDYLERHKDIDIMCNFSRNLSFSDSRCFGGSTSFLRQYLCPMLDCINELEGVYFEHVLARAAHRAIGDGKTWTLPPRVPQVVGVSGTFDVPYRTGLPSRVVKSLRYKAKRFAFSTWH